MNKVSGDYLCPECGLPVCEEMCAYGEEHSKECSVFSKLEPKLQVEDFTKPCSIYFRYNLKIYKFDIVQKFYVMVSIYDIFFTLLTIFDQIYLHIV